ncbi:hypothetical protein CDL15_Pgr004090 [Punica granatum]|uniref:Uncharacterized protein n=1 Tax=Punica granatum TaxID=22663 RepID=A0A218XGR5_PUNGR|nr:hypothetical protein CDL15_Pgr004090 [Punica granatum]
MKNQGIRGLQVCPRGGKAETRNPVPDSVFELGVSRELGLGRGRAEDSVMGELRGSRCGSRGLQVS